MYKLKKCLNCSSTTRNPKFCTQKCSAIYNNKNTPKRKRKIYLCKSGCGAQINYNRKYCKNCFNNKRIDWENMTYQYFLNRHYSFRHTMIRELARKVYKKCGKPQKCAVCEFQHIEVCHIKPINEFLPETKLKEINSPDNLVGLCPNHHYELDHGILKL